MYEIIDFVKENADNIKDYDIIYYGNKKRSMINGEAIGEVTFEMANGDTETFFIC